jgi:hypothetical protein
LRINRLRGSIMLQPTGKRVLNELVTTKISELAIVAEKKARCIS